MRDFSFFAKFCIKKSKFAMISVYLVKIEFCIFSENNRKKIMKIFLNASSLRALSALEREILSLLSASSQIACALAISSVLELCGAFTSLCRSALYKKNRYSMSENVLSFLSFFARLRSVLTYSTYVCGFCGKLILEIF